MAQISTPRSKSKVPKDYPLKEYWTTNYTIERVKYELCAFVDYIEDEETGEFVEGRRYYDLARYLQYRIGVCKPRPLFTIYLSDLSERLRQDLGSLDRESLAYLLKQAVSRIFEDTDARQYHDSVSSILEIQLI